MTYTFEMKVPHAEGSPEADAALKKFKGVSRGAIAVNVFWSRNRSDFRQSLSEGGRFQILCIHLLPLDPSRTSQSVWTRLDPSGFVSVLSMSFYPSLSFSTVLIPLNPTRIDFLAPKLPESLPNIPRNDH